MENNYLTGDRPTGKLHLGHYVGSLKQRVEIQKMQDVHQFIMIADQQGLTDNAADPLKIIKNIREVMLDYLSVGLVENKNTIFIQSQIPQLAELTVYYLNLVSIARLKRNPTVKSEIQDKDFGNSVPAGFFVYPVSQAADITAFKATHVPAGGDQQPMLEQTREIVRSFNQIYQTDVLVEPKIILSSKNQQRLVGIDGQGKMSKSLNNGIYLSDDEDTVKQKIMRMYTDPTHIHVSDPGKIEGNVVFEYLDIFAPDKQKIQQLKEEYQHGGLGDVTLKLFLNEVIQDFLTPIRKKRRQFEAEPSYVMELLKSGSETAEAVASVTLDQVKRAMGIQYF